MSSRFFETLSRIGAAVADNHTRSRARLQHFDDRQLADIGIRRDQITAIAINDLFR